MNRTIVIALSLFVLSLNCGQSYAAEVKEDQPPRTTMRSSRSQSQPHPSRSIRTLPQSRVQFNYRNNPYYFSGGLIYILVGDYYQTVDPQEGMVIPYIPQDELRVMTIGKKIYYEYYNVIYKAVNVRGNVQYEVVGRVDRVAPQQF